MPWRMRSAHESTLARVSSTSPSTMRTRSLSLAPFSTWFSVMAHMGEPPPSLHLHFVSPRQPKPSKSPTRCEREGERGWPWKSWIKQHLELWALCISCEHASAVTCSVRSG
uniref:Uncharacterized protein n=1 Tax=Arundo donax TaxID=35708 RepID=A0A0A9BXC7_ARUDO